MNIVLTGMMGTGKSAVGKTLARRLSMRFIDTDSLIEKKAGKKIKDIFADEGEGRFRELERGVVKDVSGENNCVVATGGGVVKNSENMDRLENNSVVVCLKARSEVIYDRTKNNSERPLLNVEDPLKALNKLIEEREKFYSRCDFSVDTSDKKINEIADDIIRFIKEKREYADKS